MKFFEVLVDLLVGYAMYRLLILMAKTELFKEFLPNDNRVILAMLVAVLVAEFISLGIKK